MEAPAKDEIVRAIHNSPKGLWCGKIAGWKATLYVFQGLPHHRHTIVWQATKGRMRPLVGQSPTVWHAIDAIEALQP